jgi:hypothetical protein
VPEEPYFARKGQGEGRWEALDGSAPAGSAASDGVMLWLREDAQQTLLAFSNVHGGFGPMRGWASVALVHRYLRKFALNVVYLRDPSRCLHLAGLPGLGDSYDSCVAGLRALYARRGWGKIYTLGVSAGGYGALRYGLDLGARAVLSFSGPSDVAPPADPARRVAPFGTLYRTAPGMAVDLLPLYRRSARRPRLLLCYGQGNAYDAHMARRMAEFPETELVPFAFAGHTTIVEALRLGLIEKLVGRLIGAPP